MANIDTAFINQYHAAVGLVYQQVDSRMRDKVRVEPLKGEYGYFDYIGTAELEEKTGRHQAKNYQDMDHYRRKVAGSLYDRATLVDTDDLLRMLIDPKSGIMEAFKRGANRKIDQLIFSAARGTALTGKTGATAVPLPAGQKIAHGNKGMTVADKLIPTMELFNTNNVDPELEKWMAIGPKEVSDLLKETEVGSADYNLVRPLVEGKVARYMGFNFVMSNLLTTVTTTTYCIAWVQEAICLAIQEDISRDLYQNKNFKGHPWEAYLYMMMGAARMIEEGVVEVATYHA